MAALDPGEQLLIGLFLKGHAQVICTTCLWGIYTIIIMFSTYVLVGRGVITKASLAVFLLTIVMWSVSTAYFGLLLKGNIATVVIMIGNSSLPPLQRMAQAGSEIRTLNLIQNWPRLINFAIGDCITLWRSWILGLQHYTFRFAAVIVILASITMSLYDGIKGTLDNSKGLTAALNSNIDNNIDTAAVTLSFFSNFLSTTSVAIKTWQHKKQLGDSFSAFSPHSRVERILVLIVESGAAYCALQLVGIIASIKTVVPGSSMDIGLSAYLSCLNVISGLYPSVIIILVALQRSFGDTQKFSDITTDARISWNRRRPRRTTSVCLTDLSMSAPTPESSVNDRDIRKEHTSREDV